MTRPLPQFKGGAGWQSTRNCDVERMCSYVTDDGTVAAYFRIPREEVAKVRKGIPKPKSSADPSPTSKDAEPINASTAVAYDMAKAGSERLLLAIQKMFALFERQHGLQPGEGQILQLAGFRA